MLLKLRQIGRPTFVWSATQQGQLNLCIHFLLPSLIFSFFLCLIPIVNYIGLTCIFLLPLHSSLSSRYSLIQPSIFPTIRSFFYSSLLSHSFFLLPSVHQQLNLYSPTLWHPLSKIKLIVQEFNMQTKCNCPCRIKKLIIPGITSP
jgi:hypothetical protein